MTVYPLPASPVNGGGAWHGSPLLQALALSVWCSDSPLARGGSWRGVSQEQRALAGCLGEAAQ